MAWPGLYGSANSSSSYLSPFNDAGDRLTNNLRTWFSSSFVSGRSAKQGDAGAGRPRNELNRIPLHLVIDQSSLSRDSRTLATLANIGWDTTDTEL